ncbi:TPA: phosphoglycerate mutase [bacterium]|nr:phosphoglycerate mutase [bacterium]
MKQEFLEILSVKTETKIVFLIIDGVGGVPVDGKTELEMANKPNIDNLCKDSICGIMDPIAPGITPGSGPAHLALFGYDPLIYDIGRGLLSALGIGFDLKEVDTCARGNFCTIEDGIIIDRRAGRISTEKNEGLCKILSEIKIEGIEVFVLPEKEHRFVVIFRGDDLSSDLSDSDPQVTGVPLSDVFPKTEDAKKTAEIVNQWISEVRKALASQYPANMVLLRGFANYLKIPSFLELYKLSSCCIATYPMYKGLAKLVGMDILDCGETLEDQIKILKENYPSYDFFFFHIKQTDKKGEDGDYEGKIKAIEDVDKIIPDILSLSPDVFVITGDHSTPALLKAHSWHPVPLLIYSKYCIPDGITKFSERDASKGSLGRFPMQNLMSISLAYAKKLMKFGA